MAQRRDRAAAAKVKECDERMVQEWSRSHYKDNMNSEDKTGKECGVRRDG